MMLVIISECSTSNIVDLAKNPKLNKRELLQLAKDEVREKGTKQILLIETVDNDTQASKELCKADVSELQ